MRLRRTGLTLIEVVAAIGLLATLLGMVVLASSRHTRQLRLAQDQLAAQEVADELLTQWLIEQHGQIDQPRGDVIGRPGWQWRLSGRVEPGLEPFGLHVGRVDIVRVRDPTGQQLLDSPVVLASVEFASSSVVTAEEAARGAL